MDLLKKYASIFIKYTPASFPLLGYKIQQDILRYPLADENEKQQILQSYKDILANYAGLGELRLGLDIPFDTIRFGQYLRYGDDYNQGVWIGTRGLALLQNQQISPLIAHWCVNIDGHNFSLTTDTGGADGTIQIEETDDKDRYEWFRYGKNQKSIELIRQFVRYINNQQIPYTLTNDNCQKFSLIIARFATDEEEPEYIIDQSKYNIKLTNLWRLITFRDRLKKEEFIKQNNILTFKAFQQQEKNDMDIYEQEIQNFQQQQSIWEQQGFFLPTQKNMKLFQNQNKITTIGQNGYQLPTTIGNYNSTYGRTNRFSSQSPINYDQAFQNKFDRYEKSDTNIYGSQTYKNQSRFNLFSNPNINNGFLGNNPVQPTIRRASNITGQNQDVYSSFQSIDYNLPKQTLLNQQPFNDKYQLKQNNYLEQQPFKKVKDQYQQPQFQKPTFQYKQNDYTNQLDYQDLNDQVDYNQPDEGYVKDGVKYVRW